MSSPIEIWVLIPDTVYYHVNGQLVGRKDGWGKRTYVHADHLGSTSVVTDSTEGVVEQTKYGPWGEIKVGGTKSKFQHTGQEHDGETGLNYYNARYYDPHIRRFTQPDDIIQDVYDPQSLNRYSYVRNNPLRYTDPTGHFWGVLVSIVKTIWRPVVNYVAKVAPSLPFIGPVIQKATNHPTVQQAVQKAQSVINKVQSNPVVQQVTRDPIQQQAQSIQKTVSTVKAVTQKIHGNDLRNTAQTWGYTLRDKATGVIQKFGETMHPDKRYTKEWLDSNELELFREASGTKFDMRIWEHEQIGNYIFQNGYAPALNNIERSVNVLR